MATDQISASALGLASAAQMSMGTFVASGNPASLICGFNPKYAKIINETDNIVWEKLASSPPANSVKSVAAAQTVDTGSNVLFPADVGLNEPGSAVLLSPTAAPAGKVISWVVFG